MLKEASARALKGAGQKDALTEAAADAEQHEEELPKEDDDIDESCNVD